MRYPPEYPRAGKYSREERILGNPKRLQAIKAWKEFMKVHAPEQVCVDPVENMRWAERRAGVSE